MDTATPHFPRSNAMNSGELATRRQRPTHNPSKNLSADELQSLYDILGSNCVALATAVAQVLHSDNGTWGRPLAGIFCFVKDYDKRSYCFRLYDLKSFFNDKTPRQLFEQVLAGMQISAEEKAYVRETVKSDSDLQTLISSK
ncbi:unnamed protein product [Rotaria sp. Silwood1]|nr:unnamed protein product [Rotaria sp. Silwood1]